MRKRCRNAHALCAGTVAAVLLVLAYPARAGSYAFLAAPSNELNRIYRVDTLTGEIGACQFGLNPGRSTIEQGFYGVTQCYAVGAGAGKQAPGEYALVASRHDKEGGVFRIDTRTGMISICYVFNNEVVVCTAQVR